MSTQPYDRIEQEPADDRAMQFYVFMLVFWPTAILLGLIDFSFITTYDLRLPMLLVALAAGWTAVSIYKKRIAKGDAS